MDNSRPNPIKLLVLVLLGLAYVGYPSDVSGRPLGVHREDSLDDAAPTPQQCASLGEQELSTLQVHRLPGWPRLLPGVWDTALAPGRGWGDATNRFDRSPLTNAARATLTGSHVRLQI